MIKTIIFDIGGVYFTSGNIGIIPILNKKFDIPEKKLKEIFNGKLSDLYKTGQCTAEYFWTKAKEFWSIDVDIKELEKIWFDCYIPIEGTIEIIKKLRENNYEILFLSDNTKERIDYIEEKYDFLKYFDGGIFSYKVKTRKPDPKIYQLVLKKTDSSPSECVFIDDKEKCTKAAETLGINGIVFKNPDQLEENLLKLGLNL